MTKRKQFIIFRIIPVIFFCLLFLAGGIYIYWVNDYFGEERLLSTVILVLSVIIGSVHVLLFILRKIGEKNAETLAITSKRRLDRYRVIVNWITPFVLMGMFYHFWTKEWYLANIIIAILILDRINDLSKQKKLWN